MGFFSNLFKGVRKVLDIGKGVRDTVRGIYNTAKRIPVVGGIVRTLEQSPIGQTAKQIAQTASDVLDTASQGEEFLRRNIR